MTARPAAGVTPGHTYDEADTYTVTLTVTDNQGATDTDSLVVTVTDPTGPPGNQDPVAHITGSPCTVPVVPAERAAPAPMRAPSPAMLGLRSGGTATGVSPGHTYTAAGT